MISAVLAFFMVLLLACLCWTYSRSAWIGFLVILLAAVVLDRRKFLFIGFFALVFVLIFLPSLDNIRHMHLITDNSNTSIQKEISTGGLKSILQEGGSGRFAFWNKALSIIRSSPLYGTGLNTYSKIIQQDPNPQTWWYAHNCYLQMAAETGILGLACFLWMLFVLLQNGVVFCYRFNEWKALTLLQGTVASLFGFLVQSFFDNTLYTVQLNALFWVLVGLMVAVIRLNLKGADR